jgi:hypothetical protein
MPYFAQVIPTSDQTKFTVIQVIAAEQSFIDTLPDPTTWYKTSYNTYGNVHYAPSPPAEPNTPDGGIPYRANYAGIGYTLDMNYTQYDTVGVFYAPQPYPSWILNTTTFLWEAPVPYPTDGGEYYWDEATLSWVLIPTA